MFREQLSELEYSRLLADSEEKEQLYNGGGACLLSNSQAAGSGNWPLSAPGGVGMGSGSSGYLMGEHTYSLLGSGEIASSELESIGTRM